MKSLFPDFELVIIYKGKQNIFMVHRAILGTVSQFFADTFELFNKDSRTLVLDDYPPHIVDKVLQMIYRGRVPLVGVEGLETIDAARFFGLPFTQEEIDMVVFTIISGKYPGDLRSFFLALDQIYPENILGIEEIPRNSRIYIPTRSYLNLIRSGEFDVEEEERLWEKTTELLRKLMKEKYVDD